MQLATERTRSRFICWPTARFLPMAAHPIDRAAVASGRAGTPSRWPCGLPEERAERPERAKECQLRRSPAQRKLMRRIARQIRRGNALVSVRQSALIERPFASQFAAQSAFQEPPRKHGIRASSRLANSRHELAKNSCVARDSRAKCAGKRNKKKVSRIKWMMGGNGRRRGDRRPERQLFLRRDG